MNTFARVKMAGNDCTSQGSNKGIVRMTGDLDVRSRRGNVPAQQADTNITSVGGGALNKETALYHVDVFHGHGVPRQLELCVKRHFFDALTGTATIRGPRPASLRSTVSFPGTDTLGGHFTATATLTADFEGTENGTSSTGEVHGTDLRHLPLMVSWQERPCELLLRRDFGREDIGLSNSWHHFRLAAAWYGRSPGD